MNNSPVEVWSDGLWTGQGFYTCLFNRQQNFSGAPFMTQNGNMLRFDPRSPNGSVGWIFYGVY
jgi:hypothetical protein